MSMVYKDRVCQIYCNDCHEPVWISDTPTEDIESCCSCLDKVVKCDCCELHFKPKDMSVQNIFLSLCKDCNSQERFNIDYQAEGELEGYPSRSHTVMCVDEVNGRLQVTIRSYSLKYAVRFPAMEKREIIDRWMQSTSHSVSSNADLLFDCAVLRLKEDYFGEDEFHSLVRQWKRDKCQ